MIIQLPNGLLDGQDLFNYAEIEELKGKQQNYLANKELVVGNIGHIPKILEDLVVALTTKEGLKWKGDISEAIWKLPSGDLETILVKIREATYGNRFYFEAECSKCGHTNKDLRLDLDKLELDVMTVEEMLAKEKRTAKLPRSGKEVELKPIYLKDLFKVIKITMNSNDELITSVISLSLKRIDDNSSVTSKEVEELPAADIQFLQKEVESMKLEGSLDTDVEVECSECKKEFKTKLNVYSPDFFDPTRGSKNSNI